MRIFSSILTMSVVLGGLSTLTLSGASIILGVNNGSNLIPFGTTFSGNPGTHYQEAYDSSLFSGAISITGIDFFRRDAGSLYGGTYQLSLSTISAAVSALGSGFAALGGNNAVFDMVALSGAAPSTLIFTGGPFLYNPANGNLLLDITITNPVNGTAGFQDGGGTGLSTIARYQNFTSAGFGPGYGLVTEFDFTSTVPEPATLTLLGCGLACILIRRCRRA